MGIGNWWNRMKDTYGDDPNAFKSGMVHGKALTVDIKVKKMINRSERRRKRKEIKKKLKRRIK